MKKLFCVIIFFLAISLTVKSQNLNLILPNTTAACGATFDVPVKVTNFQNLVSLQFSIAWLSSSISFVGIQGYGPSNLALTSSNFGVNNSTNGILTFSWNDANLSGVTLVDSTVLFILQFTAGSSSSNSTLQFSNSPAVIEAINSQLISVNVTTVNGSSTVNCSSVMPLHLITLNQSAVCSTFLDIPVRIKNFQNLLSLQFTFNWDHTRLSYNSITNFGPSNIGLTASNFGTSLTGNGKIMLSWFDSDLSGESLPDSTILFTLRFSVLALPGQANLQFTNSPTTIEAINSNNIPVPVSPVGSSIQVSCSQSNALQLYMKDTAVTCGDVINIPIRVNGYQSMVSHQGTISWDPTKFTFNAISHFGPTSLGQNISNFGTTLTPSGKITFSWNDNDLSGETLPDSTSIFTLQLNVVATGGTSSVQFINNPTIIEFINSQFNVVNPQISNSSISITCGNCTATLSGGATVCMNATSPAIIFTGSGGIPPYTFTYTINGGSPLTISTTSGNSVSVLHNTNVSGVFVYNLINVSSNGCFQQLNISQTVTVTAPPSAGTLSGNQNICIGGTTTFSSTVTGGSWTSSNTSIATVNATTGVVTGVTAGTATITYTVTGTGGCADATATRTVTVTAPPSAGTLSGNQSICVGGSTTFVSTVTGGSWSSSNTGVATINVNTGAISGVAAGTATMTYTVAGTGGCADATTTRTVTVNPLPIAIIQTPASTFICQGSTLLLTASGGISYQWFLNNQAINGAIAANYNASQSGVYTVKATSPQGCVSGMSNPVTLSIINAPVADFSFDKYCAQVLIQFSNLSTTVGSGVVAYSWLFGDGISSTLPTPTHTYLQAGTFSVSLSVTPIACPNLRSTKVKSIVVEKNPGNIRYRTINAVIGQQVQLNARNFVNANYNWVPSVGLNNFNTAAPIFNFNQEKEYLIKIITQAGCVSTDTQLVRVFDRIDIFVADAFTPNSDGKNDKIIPKLVGVQNLNYFKVINRWGQLLFTTNIEGEGWDGFYKGVKQQLDTYAWIAEGVDLLGNVIKRSGTFILIR